MAFNSLTANSRTGVKSILGRRILTTSIVVWLLLLTTYFKESVGFVGVGLIGSGESSMLKNELPSTSPLALHFATNEVSSGTPTKSLICENSKTGIIFDIDGTLADSWKLGYDATAVVLKKHNLSPITREIYFASTGYSTSERLARHAGLTPSHPDFHAVGKKLARDFDDLYIGLVSRETAGFFDGIEELIRTIPLHVKLGALTNANARYARAVLETNCPVKSRGISAGVSSSTTLAVGIYERFVSIQGADTVLKPKPAPDGLLLCCEQMGITPEKCVYVGDSPSDAVAAESAGMKSIGVLWGAHTEETLSRAPFNRLCRTVEELHAVLVKNSSK